MIKYYDDSLLEYINIKPLITKDKNYEKLIIGSNVKKKISIVFQIDDIDIFNQILYIVDKHNIPVTLFMDVKRKKSRINFTMCRNLRNFVR